VVPPGQYWNSSDKLCLSDHMNEKCNNKKKHYIKDIMTVRKSKTNKKRAYRNEASAYY
jgi:hypothetical protein